jgi:L-ornithine N5-oxygenase
VFHFTHYLEYAPELARRPAPRIAVIGGSQSAVELVLDASRRFPTGTVTNIVRGFGYRQKDLSPFSGEVYYPQFVDYYFTASDESKRILDQQLRHTNYSSADIDVVQALYARLYEQRLDDSEQIRLMRNTEVVHCDPAPEGVRLTMRERHLGTVGEVTADAVVLATGFVDLTDERGELFLPPLLTPVSAYVARTPSGRALIGRDYRLTAAPDRPLPPIYLNGLCETTHGMGDAGSFSLLSLRGATIAESLYRAVSSRAGAPLTASPKQREGVRA